MMVEAEVGRIMHASHRRAAAMVRRQWARSVLTISPCTVHHVGREKADSTPWHTVAIGSARDMAGSPALG
jgi:hypothetical protein